MEYETDGYIVSDTTSKANTLPKEILNSISSQSAEAKAVVDAAVKNKKATFQDLYNGLVGVKSLGSPAAVSKFLDSIGVIGQNDNGQVLIYDDKKVNVISRKEISYAEKGRETKAKGETKTETKPTGKTETKTEGKTETKPTGKTETKADTKAETKTESTTAPTFAAYDSIFDERSKKTEARNSFIEEHGKPVYDAMNEISTKFTKIIKDLEDKGVLTKKC
jgi:hypothetical protein